MIVRENEALESWKAMRINQENCAAKEKAKIDKAVELRENTRKNIYNTLESRLQKERSHGALLESCKNNELAKVIKAVYITALEANSLTDNAIFLAENMVESWIKEKGGASNIFRENENKTYFLSRIQQIVEDAAEEDVKDIEKDESGDSEEDGKDSEKEENTKDDNESSKKDETDKESDKSENNNDSSSNEKNDVLNTTFDDDEDNEQNSEINDDESDIVDDNEEENDLESDGESHGKVFDELEKEEDVKKAIELIRQRVADAEETFIKRNAEDKKQIDELLGKISDNIKTVKDMDDDSSTESKIAQESASMARRKINSITENRPLSVFEKMTRALSPSIIKNETLKEQYTNESGQIDFPAIVESAKVMYGFLETLNTLQLEKVDEKYITKVLNEM